MLISEISANLLRENKIPMLYADARNPASNAAYEKIGFIKQGEVTEFVFGGC
ncbi:MAG TPA: GNAT family N-acetyltransferase [Lachnospiraceae bacterium]|nr:GNAT family N-acetyltransferase [Lachnospiraceae bacterium]